MTQALTLNIGRKRYPVLSLQEASEKFCAVRDATGMRSSTMPLVSVASARGEKVARVSYNGRVWPTAPWTPEQKPLYDNRIGA